MRVSVMLALVCVAGAYAYPAIGGGGYHGSGGSESGYGRQGYMSGGGISSGVYDNSNSGFRRVEESHSSRNFGAQQGMGRVNQGAGSYGFNRGSGMYGGGGAMGG